MEIQKDFFVHLFHVIFIGGLFLYLGIKKTDVPDWMYNPVAGLGAFIILYHIYKAYLKTMDKKFPWVNYIHIFIIGPLLVYIGMMKEKTPRFGFELILMSAFAAIGYHGYYLFF